MANIINSQKMNPPKNFKEFLAQQKANAKKKSSSPIEQLISDLKLNPSKFISEYQTILPKITSKENPELKNFHDENLITLFIDEYQINLKMNNEYNTFMKLAAKGFFTLNKNKETFLFELARRNNLRVFFETILNLHDLNLLNDELLLVQNNNSENCFSYFLNQINSVISKNIMMKKDYNNLIEKALKIIMEKYKFFDTLKPLDKFNIFNYFTKIKISDESLANLSKDDILKDFDIIFSSQKNFDICKVILYDKQIRLNILTLLLENENFTDLVDVFIQKYIENKFCNYPELFFDFLMHILNFEKYKNIEHFLPKIIDIIILEKNYETKINGNIYNCLFSNSKLIPKEKNLIFNSINERLFKNNNDLISQFLCKENNEFYPSFISYLLLNNLNNEDNKLFVDNILEKASINIKKNKNTLRYQGALNNLLAKDKYDNFLILFEYLEKNKLINIFENMGNDSCFLNDIITKQITNDLVISKFIEFITKNFNQVINFTHLKYLLKFLSKYVAFIKIEELKNIINLIKDKAIIEIKKEEDKFIQKIKNIKNINYQIINKSLFVFKSKYNDFYKSLADLISEIWFNQENDLQQTKDILITILDLIGVYKYNEIILYICSSNEKFIHQIIDVFVEKYYTKFNLTEDKYLQYYSLFNFQNEFWDNNKLKNKNYMYFYLRFIHGIENVNTKIYYQNMIYSILYYYKYETNFPLLFTEKDIDDINNNSKLFAKPKLLQDEIKLNLLSTLFDYKNEYKKNIYFFVKKFDDTNTYSVVDILNNNKNVTKINFEIKFDSNDEKYKTACDLLNKHFMCKFYMSFFNSLIKKGKAYKFLNLCIKEISKLISDETTFIEISNYQLKEFIKYIDAIKEKKCALGEEGDEIKNENNIFGLNILFLLFKKMTSKTFDENELFIKENDDIKKYMVNFKISYLKEFNIISNDEEEKIFISEGKDFFKKKYLENHNENNDNKEEKKDDDNFIKNNYNLEKYFLLFYNFNNANYFKKLPCENKSEVFKVFKALSEKIKNTKFIEILFKDKNDSLKNMYEKINFEDIAKFIKKENELNNIKSKIVELKEVKEINFKSFFDCLIKFWECLV